MSLWEIRIGRWRPVYALGLFYVRHSPFAVFKEFLRHGVLGHAPPEALFTNKDGIIFHLNVTEAVQKGIYCFHYSEPKEIAAFRRLMKPGGRVFDVGANVGQYALLASRLVGKTGEVYAFEPNPIVLPWLRENIALNGAANIHLVPKAAAAQSRRMEFYLPSEDANQDLGSLLPVEGTSVQKAVEVEAVSLDDFCDAHGIEHIDFLKVDAEGFDLEVLKGAQRVMARSPDLIVMAEVVPMLLDEAGTTPEAFYAFMDGHGFRPWITTGRGRLIPLGDRTAHLLNVFFIPGARPPA